MKTCTKCREGKPLTEFYKHKSRKDGLSSRCKPCTKADVKAYASSDQGKSTNAANRSSPEYRAKAVARTRRWREEDPDRARDLRRSDYEKHRESRIAQVMRYRSLNPSVHNRSNAKRRASLKGATVDGYLFTAEELASFYGRACLVPGCEATEPTLDHVIPLSKGGLHHASNFQPLCQSHNSQKGVKSTDYRPVLGEIHLKEVSVYG